MLLTTFALAAVLAQDPTVTTPTPAAAPSDSDKALSAAQKAAEAAEKAAQAVEKMAALLTPKDEAAAAAPSASGWAGSAGVGFSFITGNTQTLTLTGNVAVDKKWTDWALGIRLSGAYGLANPTANVVNTPTNVTARRAAGTVRGDRSFGTGIVSVFVLGGAEFDHMKNIEFRGLGEAGASFTIFNKKETDYEKLFLRADVAARAGYETRYQYFPGPNLNAKAVDPYGIIILAPRAAVTLRWGINKHVKFSQEFEFIPFLLAPDFGRLLMNSNTKFSARITESLALQFGVLLAYDSKPPGPAQGSPGARLPLDASITGGVELAF